MKSKSSEKILVKQEIIANINGTSFTISGESQYISGSGEVSASVRTRQVMPSGFHLSLLPSILLTGLPAASRVTDGTSNPFIATGGVSHTTRSLKFGRHGELLAVYHVERTSKGLQARFDFSGEIDVPTLVSVAPTIETWIPNGPGRILGHFTMVWKAKDGSYVKGEAESQYRLPSQENLPGVQYRDIRIDFSTTKDSLTQSEHIVLLTSDGLARGVKC